VIAHTVRRAAIAGVMSLALATASEPGQGRIAGTATETRAVTDTLGREVDRLALRRTALWFAYRIQTLPARQFCGGSHIVLEPTTQITIMGKIESGSLTRVRVFTPECDVDAGNVPLVWLEGVTVDDSARWLTTVIQTQKPDREWRSRVVDPSLRATALHPGLVAIRSLIELARNDSRTDIRSRALLALGQRAGDQAAPAISRATEADSEASVRRAAVTALGRLPKDEGVPLLISIARTGTRPDVRREAIQQLGRSNDPRAVEFFAQILMQ
jgi:hypothetical protein